MEQATYFAAVAVPVVVLLIATGWWRIAFAVFGIRRRRMTIERLGFVIRSPADAERVNGILASFSGGFNAMIARPSFSAWMRYCDSLPAVYRPFAHEGAAMGHTLRRLFRYHPAVFEEQMVRPRPGFRYLSYVGLGFWSAMRSHEPQRLTRVVEGLDPLYGFLCYDGYGFKHGFFDYLQEPACLGRFDLLAGYARNVAYQGVGRAFWFLFMGDHDALIEHIRRLGPYACDAAAGLGLAAVFVSPDKLEIALRLGAKLPPEWHDQFHLGMCFGLKARSINDPGQFGRDLARMDREVQEAIRAAIRECDQAEHRVRTDGGKDGYRRWRGRVTRWMASHVQYPLAGIKPLVRGPLNHEPAPT